MQCSFELSLFCVRDYRVTLVRSSANARKSLLHKQANPLKIWSFAFIEQHNVRNDNATTMIKVCLLYCKHQYDT